MQFEPTAEQSLLRDSVRRFVERDYKGRKLPSFGFDAAIWKKFAELGWLAAGLSEEAGGLGGGIYENALIAEAFGHGLVGEPFIPVAVIASQLLHQLAPGSELLEKMLLGETRPVLAHFEAEGRGDVEFVATTATPVDSRFVLRGAKSAVLGGPSADIFLVSCRTPGAPGLTLFALNPDMPGFVRRDYRTVDNRGASNLVLDDVRVGPETIVGKAGGSAAAIERAADHGLVVSCAEAVGSMQAAFELTRDYLRTRKQFGVPIGDFQALRHRLADMFIETEQARAIVVRALAAFEDEHPVERARLASAARVRVAQAGRFVTAQAIQLHGGIGITEEYAVGHYFKRMTVFGLLFGPDAVHLERYVRLGRIAEKTG